MKNPAIKAMQMAVDIVNTSPHPSNKVAACLFDNTTAMAKTNEWPKPIAAHIGFQTRIGDSSGTIHAETNCLLNFPQKTHGAKLAITDPCCPNCAKSIAESGVAEIYIDHKGFQKDFAARRGDDFKNMSLNILAHAGISIFEINRKLETITPIFQPENGYIAPEDNPINIKPFEQKLSKNSLQYLVNDVQIKHPRWGAALAKDQQGKIFSLIASTHPAIGYSGKTIKDAPSPQETEKKYDFYLEPLHRLLFGCAKHGLKPIENYIWVSTLPTARELINLISADITSLYLGHHTIPKKDNSYKAKELLEKAGILKFLTMNRED